MDNTEKYLLPNEKKHLTEETFSEAKVPFKKLSKLSSTERKKYDIDYLLKKSKDIKSKKFVLFNKHGQYLSAHKTYDDAVRHVRRLDDTEGWVSEPIIIQFESINEMQERRMTAVDKKKAMAVKKMYDADEPMAGAAGMKLKAAAKELERKYGKGWMKMIESKTFGPSKIPLPMNSNELKQMIKAAPNIKAKQQDTFSMFGALSDKLAAELDKIVTREKPYKSAFDAGIKGDKEPKNPFKKDTLAFWMFADSYVDGRNND